MRLGVVQYNWLIIGVRDNVIRLYSYVNKACVHIVMNYLPTTYVLSNDDPCLQRVTCCFRNYCFRKKFTASWIVSFRKYIVLILAYICSLQC